MALIEPVSPTGASKRHADGKAGRSDSAAPSGGGEVQLDVTGAPERQTELPSARDKHGGEEEPESRYPENGQRVIQDHAPVERFRVFRIGLVRTCRQEE